MMQTNLFTPAPATRTETPRAKGERLGQACHQKAEAGGWDSEGAARFILGRLRAYGPTSGEDLTDAAIAHGYRPHDGRAFGGVFSRLARTSQIRKVTGAVCLRRKGHGTAGGVVWEAV